MINFIKSDNIHNDISRILIDTFNTLYMQILIDRNGKIIYINDKYANFFNIPKENIIGKQIEELIPNTLLYETMETGIASNNDFFTYEDGRQVLYSKFPIKNSQGVVLGAITASSLNTFEEINNLQNKIRDLEKTNYYLNQKIHGLDIIPSEFNSIIGKSKKIQKIKMMLSKISNKSLPILITGETGTGKEVFASAIHNASIRKNAPFVKINCSAMPKDLVESELFGYVSGTFTGARREGKAGKFELANHGTILLDEIEELSLDAQSKLLRVLEEFEVERIGSINPIPLDIQIICCSNRNLYKMVKEKNFREDLLYRINVIEIDIPPLRERIEDIPELCYSILKNINKRYNLNIDSISEETLKLLSSYNWPGNVRELVHALERACVVTDNPILQADDFYFISKKIVSKSEETECSNNYFYNKKFQEKNFIVDILKSCKGNKSLAAKTLGISRSLLYYKIKELNIKL